MSNLLMKETIIAPKRFRNIAPNFVYAHFLGGPLSSSHPVLHKDGFADSKSHATAL